MSILELKEYGDGIDVSALTAGFVSPSQLFSSVARANRRIQKELRSTKNFLVVTDGKLRAEGFAGCLRLSLNLQINVIPKFWDNISDKTWIDTLYLLSSLSRYGSILTKDSISASTSYLNSLYEIAARIIAEDYLRNSHKPIRKYHRERIYDFAIDGDIEFSSPFENNPDGIEQLMIRFDSANQFNAAIKRAAEIVLPYTKDLRVQTLLKDLITRSGKQPALDGSRHRVPVRNREWDRLYNLAFDICRGMGSGMRQGGYFADGFVADTWRLWEWLITAAVKLGKKKEYVVPQEAVTFGSKTFEGTTTKINVYPDIVVYAAKGDKTPLLLLDAKYKTTPLDGGGVVDTADIYEACAFCDATSCNNIYLVFPYASGTFDVAGTVKEVSTYSVSSKTIHVIKVAFGALNERGGLVSFARTFADTLDSVL